MKVIIAGGREFDNYELMCEEMAKIRENITITEVVCGGARGADSLGRQWAQENGIPVKEFPAEWDVFGKQAGILRNHDMGNYADFLVAFWDGKSTGTQDMISFMKRIGKHGRVVKYSVGEN